MNGHFIGNVDGGEVRHYMFRARGNTAQTFKPETFRFMHMVAMNDEQRVCYMQLIEISKQY